MRPSVQCSSWGVAPATSLQPAQEVERFRLTVDSLAIEVVTLGASLFVVETPDQTGAVANVVLGLPDLPAALDRPRNHNLGATIGRYANRIGGAAFSIDGVRSEVQANEPPNQLHGGDDGWGRLVWAAESQTGDTWAELQLTMVSPDNDNEFPGEVTATTTYRIEPGVLTMTHEATTTAPTVVSMTNHAYWNLAGAGSARGHELQVAAARRLAVGDDKIPTGELIDNRGTGYDLRTPRSVAALVGEFGGLDDCYVLDADLEGRPAAVLSDRGAGAVWRLRPTSRPFRCIRATSWVVSLSSMGRCVSRPSSFLMRQIMTRSRQRCSARASATSAPPRTASYLVCLTSFGPTKRS
ncbi:MAG: aldose epimerase family protein [Acidimicrobiales bacterium]